MLNDEAFDTDPSEDVWDEDAWDEDADTNQEDEGDAWFNEDVRKVTAILRSEIGAFMLHSSLPSCRIQVKYEGLKYSVKYSVHSPRAKAC